MTVQSPFLSHALTSSGIAHSFEAVDVSGVVRKQRRVIDQLGRDEGADKADSLSVVSSYSPGSMIHSLTQP